MSFAGRLAVARRCFVCSVLRAGSDDVLTHCTVHGMASSTYPTKAWFLAAGVAMLCSLRVGVMAFRSLNPARGSAGRSAHKSKRHTNSTTVVQ